jgi:hypothetical protein
MRIAPLVIVALTLSGCSSAGLVANQLDTSTADQRACSRYGFAPKTDGFAQCMLQLDQVRAQRNENAQDRRGAALVGLLTGQ